jgi:DNA-binding GntR family transcriptional regulator
MNQKPYKPIWEKIADKIKEDIMDGIYLPGERLRENELAEKYASSKTPVKEALRYLEGIGFVEIVPYTMTLVKRMNREEVSDLYSIESVLEGLAARRAASHLSKGQISRMGKYIEQLEKNFRENNHVRHEKANIDFHSVLWEASGSAKLQELINSIRQQLQRFRTVTRRHPERFADLVADHRKILETLVQGDPGEAERVVRRHFERSGEIIMDLLEAGDGGHLE